MASLILHGAIATLTVALIVYLSLKIIQTHGFIYLTVLSVWSKLLINICCVAQFEIANLFLSLFAVGAMVMATVFYLGLSHPGKSSKFILNETFTRMEFLMFTASICTLIFYVLQPRVSERDLQALSYVRLDGIMRKLLQHDDGLST
ncbi:hypothetical protein ScPMuIL_001324 [Solemya velum]